MSLNTPPPAPPEGTLALVRTPTFRCLGILRDGQWYNAYQIKIPLDDVLDYEPLPGFDPMALRITRPPMPLTGSTSTNSNTNTNTTTLHSGNDIAQN